MPVSPACPQCTLTNTYVDGANFVCADCGFEWPVEGEGETSSSVVAS